MTPARLLVYKLMVAAPIVLMTAMGVQSRTSVPTFEFVQSDASHEDALYAYLEPYRQAAHSIKGMDPESFAASRVVAHKWLELSKKGVLKPIEPVAYEDTVMDGAKGQILREVQLMSAALAWGAQGEERHGKYQAAADDALLGIQIAQILKYSDFQSLSALGMSQRKCLGVLMATLPKCPSTERVAVSAALSKLFVPKAVLGHLARRAQSQYREHQIRLGVDPVTIQETDRVVINESGLTSDAAPEVVLKQLRHATLAAASDDATPELLSFVRVGYMSEIETNRRISEAIQIARR